MLLRNHYGESHFVTKRARCSHVSLWHHGFLPKTWGRLQRDVPPFHSKYYYFFSASACFAARSDRILSTSPPLTKSVMPLNSAEPKPPGIVSPMSGVKPLVLASALSSFCNAASE